MKSPRSLWEDPAPVPSFAEALTRDVALTDHDCPSWYAAYRPHAVGVCPGHVGLSALLTALKRDEPSLVAVEDPAQARGRLMHRARTVMGESAWKAATTPSDLAAAIHAARLTATGTVE